MQFKLKWHWGHKIHENQVFIDKKTGEKFISGTIGHKTNILPRLEAEEVENHCTRPPRRLAIVFPAFLNVSVILNRGARHTRVS